MNYWQYAYLPTHNRPNGKLEWVNWTDVGPSVDELLWVCRGAGIEIRFTGHKDIPVALYSEHNMNWYVRPIPDAWDPLVLAIVRVQLTPEPESP